MRMIKSERPVKRRQARSDTARFAKGKPSPKQNLGGQLKTGNVWTGQNRQCPAAETSEFYFRPLVRAQVGLHLCPPAPRPALEHVRVMEQAIE